MRLISIVIIILFCRFSFLAQASENKMTPEQYIHNYNEAAIKEMMMYDIPASITLAQGMLESNNGNSDLAVYANNHFGIKCHSKWNGLTFIKDDDKKDECFRKYPSVLDSYNDHSLFLISGSRYGSLFELKRTDYKGWAKGLKEAGYATDTKYPERLLNLIESYKLYEYDHVEGEQKNKSSNDWKHKAISRNTKKNTTVLKHATPSHPELNHSVEILRFHFIKYIVVKPGDSFSKIAKETDKDLWQLYKYNDMKADEELIAGQKIYLQPKRRKAKQPFHIVKKGETMKYISQLYGIRLKSLYKKNNMKAGEEPLVGQQLYMRSRKK
jgi:LysM repeat protein